MPDAHESRSEVARLLSRISMEYEAAQQGLCGLSAGTARHDFISARTENISRCHEELVELVGPEQAISILATVVWSPQDRGIVP